MDERFLRNKMLWGREAQQRLSRSHVILFGLGGVADENGQYVELSGFPERIGRGYAFENPVYKAARFISKGMFKGEKS